MGSTMVSFCGANEFHKHPQSCSPPECIGQSEPFRYHQNRPHAKSDSGAGPLEVRRTPCLYGVVSPVCLDTPTPTLPRLTGTWAHRMWIRIRKAKIAGVQPSQFLGLGSTVAFCWYRNCHLRNRKGKWSAPGKISGIRV